MSLTLIGKKKGMTSLFDEKGNKVVCSVIEIEPNLVCQIKNKESDGYEAIQLSGINLTPSRVKNVSKPLVGHFKKAGVNPKEKLKESRVTNPSEYQIGQEIGVTYFAGCAFVDVSGVSKGRGYQGVIRRHHFAGLPAAHGCGPIHRHGGSCGMRSTPGRCLPGQKKAGHLGDEKVTTESLKVVKVDERGFLVVQGSIPGHRNCVVYVRKAKKRQVKQAK